MIDSLRSGASDNKAVGVALIEKLLAREQALTSHHLIEAIEQSSRTAIAVEVLLHS